MDSNTQKLLNLYSEAREIAKLQTEPGAAGFGCIAQIVNQLIALERINDEAEFRDDLLSKLSNLETLSNMSDCLDTLETKFTHQLSQLDRTIYSFKS